MSVEFIFMVFINIVPCKLELVIDNIIKLRFR